MSDVWRGVIADIERCATLSGRVSTGSYSIEGTRLHERAIAAGVELRKAVVGKRYARSEQPRVRRLIEQLEASSCALHIVDDEVIARLTAGRGDGDVVGLVGLPAAPVLDEIVRRNPDGCALLLAVGVEDPGNVGALVRTGLASGAAAFVGIGSCDPFHPRAVRTSMGSLFRLPVILQDDLEPMFRRLRELGVTTVGAVSSGGTPLPRLSVDRSAVALCMGNESTGLPDEIRGRIDRLVTIPMGATIDSYSVNAAAAILLYELLRPR